MLARVGELLAPVDGDGGERQRAVGVLGDGAVLELQDGARAGGIGGCEGRLVGGVGWGWGGVRGVRLEIAR